MPDEPTERHRSSTNRLALRYSLGLTSAQLTHRNRGCGGGDFAQQPIPECRPGGADADEPRRSWSTVFIVGTVVTAFGGYRSIAPSLRWFTAGAYPDATQRRGAINLVRRQSAILLTTWALSGVVLIAANADSGASTAVCSSSPCCSAARRACSTRLLFTQRIVPADRRSSQQASSSAVRRHRAWSPGWS